VGGAQDVEGEDAPPRARACPPSQPRAPPGGRSPGPVPYTWPPAHSPAILATMFAAAGTTVTAVSVLNAAVALLLILKVTTPL